jgi:N-carbamoyl-L-amino-acid hydrolase
MGGNQVGTAGLLELEPNLVNVIARRGKVTVDLRNTDEAALQEAERRMAALVAKLQKEEGLSITPRRLARFQPVEFEPAMVERVAAIAEGLGHNVRRMPSGAGHDAQMFAPNCPTAMIFVPSKGGISHNVREHTAPQDIANGANVLLQVLLSIASE